MYTVKTALVSIQIIYLYKEYPHTFRNKGDLDLDREKETKTSSI